jgi:hypothetical protein
VLHDRGAQPVDDLAATRLGEARTTHRVDWLADQPINVNAEYDAVWRKVRQACAGSAASFRPRTSSGTVPGSRSRSHAGPR